MAKHAGLPSKATQKAAQRRWQAEELVRAKVLSGPAFEKAVRKVEKELSKVEKGIPPMKP